jgi:hypothetical protein
MEICHAQTCFAGAMQRPGCEAPSFKQACHADCLKQEKRSSLLEEDRKHAERQVGILGWQRVVC